MKMFDNAARCPREFDQAQLPKFPLSISYPWHEAIAFTLRVCDMEICFESC